jgi:Leucine-rich repeat (LRR) protein
MRSIIISIMGTSNISQELTRIARKDVENFISVDDSLNSVITFLASINSLPRLEKILTEQYDDPLSSEIVRTALALHLLQAFGDERESILISMLPRETSICFYMHVLRFLEAHENQFAQFRDAFLERLENLFGIVRQELFFFLEQSYVRYKEYKACEHEIVALHQKHADFIGKDHLNNYLKYLRNNYVYIRRIHERVSHLDGLSISGELVFFSFGIEDDLVVQLNFVPNSIKTLSHLTHLSVEAFDFSEFPFFDKIEGFNRLKFLRLRDNAFQRVPDSVPFFDTLETLSYNNESGELPKWVVEFAFQGKIYQKYVDVGVHPDDAPVLNLLEVLWECALRPHDDTRLDQPAPNYVLDEDGHVIELLNTGEELPLRLFPSQLCKLTHLKILCLAYMEITSIPDCVKNMKSLASIFLEGNPIQRIPDVSDLPKTWVDELKRVFPGLIRDQK